MQDYTEVKEIEPGYLYVRLEKFTRNSIQQIKNKIQKIINLFSWITQHTNKLKLVMI